MVISLSIISCKNDDDNLNNTCSVANPIEDLDWLKEKIEELEQSSLFESGEIYISQANYNGNTIFILGNCCALCNSVISVYDCEGELIARLGYDDENDFVINFDIFERDTIIWSPPNFTCGN